MRILIAEDDLVSRKMLEATLARWGYEVVITCDGEAAWQALQQADAPRIAILDWMMPGLDGVDVCRRVRARLQAGIRIVTLQAALALRVHELEEAIGRVRTLQGLLPICSYCKRVRNDGDYWQQVESYVSDHSDARFSHGICPDCYETVVRPQLASLTPPDSKAS